MKPNYDFSGWATKNDLKCSDGRVIRKDAFKHNDGLTVPLVWNHQHNEAYNVLGHAELENRPEGVYAYGTFNDTENGKTAKELVLHGDIGHLSILANKLKQNGSDVIHGFIREVSLVLSGANEGAVIESIIEHAEDGAEEAIIFTGENLSLSHASDDKQADENGEGAKEKENKNMGNESEKTVKDVFDTLTEEQKTVVYALLGQALEDNGEAEHNDTNDEGDDTQMKHNVFDRQDDTQDNTILTHADQLKIITSAKTSPVGKLSTAIQTFIGDGATLAHGIDDIDTLFPEYKDVRPGAPELLTTDQGWIGKVLAKVHKSPISRIRTRQADVRVITPMRAKGYVKGDLKVPGGNLALVSRTTDPQTVYVKSYLDRDDIIDITDFDIVQYLYGIDRMNLNEELATAILLGDGREPGTDGKIDPDHIRPVWTDDELYTLHADIDIVAMRAELQGTDTGVYFGDNFVYAEAIIQKLLYTREQYKGSGSPDLYCTPHLLNVMLLARDRNGHRMYTNVGELQSTLNVGSIITVEQFEGKTRTTTDNKTKKLLALMYNLADYSLGSTKGGEITHFTDFDIDFNQQKSLLETRVSGANTRVLSAIALEEDITDQP